MKPIKVFALFAILLGMAAFYSPVHGSAPPGHEYSFNKDFQPAHDITVNSVDIVAYGPALHVERTFVFKWVHKYPVQLVIGKTSPPYSKTASLNYIPKLC